MLSNSLKLHEHMYTIPINLSIKWNPFQSSNHRKKDATQTVFDSKKKKKKISISSHPIFHEFMSLKCIKCRTTRKSFFSSANNQNVMILNLGHHFECINNRMHPSIHLHITNTSISVVFWIPFEFGKFVEKQEALPHNKVATQTPLNLNTVYEILMGI